MELTERLKQLMSPEDRKALGKNGQTYEEVEAGACVKLERELHNQYTGFLRRNEFDMFIHADPSKKSTIKAGWPDFAVFRNGRVLLIEFKVGTNDLSPMQTHVIEGLRATGFTVLVSYSYEKAVRATLEFFKL